MSRRRSELPAVRELIATRGLLAAANALIEVCQDKKAQASARATAGTTLFRAGGLFDKCEDEKDLEPAEMTGDQLRRRLADLQRQAAERELSRADENGKDESVWADESGEEESDDENTLFD